MLLDDKNKSFFLFSSISGKEGQLINETLHFSMGQSVEKMIHVTRDNNGIGFCSIKKTLCYLLCVQNSG
jgi:hypothetical protein